MPRARRRGQTRYYLPGGKREAGETDQQTLLREIDEEPAVACSPASLIPLGTCELSALGYVPGETMRTATLGCPLPGTL
ncbi:NUDIX domain-containing protein [Hymenobacter sp. UYCo722]|uniref:NUDIX domain-containing protein n=1 Tax=Hymenobacter sp. UYCo722 TaxID=3156335 RepID=UPI003392FB7A